MKHRLVVDFSDLLSQLYTRKRCEDSANSDKDSLSVAVLHEFSSA